MAWNAASFHPKQIEIARELGQRSVLRCGRRFGKTTLMETLAVIWAAHGRRVGWFAPNYKLVLPSYKRILRSCGPSVVSKSKIDMLIETKTKRGEGVVEFWTLNDEDAGRSRFYDWVIIDEASLAPGLREIWEQSIAPTLLDRKGRAVMAGTPKGVDPDNYFYNACNDKALGWAEFFAPTASNPMLDPDAVARLKDEYPPLVYQQEFLAEFVDWTGSAFFGQDSLLVDGKPLPPPKNCDAVFAVIDSATKTGKEHDGTGLVFFAQDNLIEHPLKVLDWDYVQIEGALLETWLPSVFERLERYAAQCGARHGSLGVYIEDKASGMILLQQARNRGWPAIEIDSKLTAVGKDERSISVSGYVYRGEVKFCEAAFDKTVNFKGVTRNHLLAQVVGYRVGQKNAQDDLLDCFDYGIALALGDSEGF